MVLGGKKTCGTVLQNVSLGDAALAQCSSDTCAEKATQSCTYSWPQGPIWRWLRCNKNRRTQLIAGGSSPHHILCTFLFLLLCHHTCTYLGFFLLFLLLYPSLKVKIALLTSSVREDTDTSQEPIGPLRPQTSYALIIRRTSEGTRELVSLWRWLV